MHRHIIAPFDIKHHLSLPQCQLQWRFTRKRQTNSNPTSCINIRFLHVSYILGPHTKDRSYMCHTTHRYLAQYTIQLHVTAATASLPLTQTICVKHCNETCRSSQYTMQPGVLSTQNEISHQSNLHANSHKLIASTHQAYARHTPSSRLALTHALHNLSFTMMQNIASL